jgi:hypothetical protein
VFGRISDDAALATAGEALGWWTAVRVPEPANDTTTVAASAAAATDAATADAGMGGRARRSVARR